jgi:hypothetical protein
MTKESKLVIGATRLSLAAIVAVAMGLALRWVFLVPIFQSPDEFDHFDYAMCLNEHGALLRALPNIPVNLKCHPYTLHLINSTDALDIIRLRRDAHMPQDYGSRAYFAEINRTAPSRAACRADLTPGIVALYPFGYYGMLAVWLEGVRRLAGDQPVSLFFGARCLSVLLLGISLLLTYGILRQLHARRLSALVVTGCIGCFPMVSFVASYVQPDNLGLTLVSACCYLALRLRHQPAHAGLQAIMGLVLGLLLITKLHLYLCVFLCTLAMLGSLWLTSQPRWSSVLRGLLLLTLPSVPLGLVHLWVTADVRNHHLVAAPYTGFSSYYLGGFVKALGDFFRGTTHQSFWGVFNWLCTPLVIGRPETNRVIQFIVQAASWILLGLTLVRLEQAGTRLILLAWRGRIRRSMQLALGNVPVNSYFLFTVVMFALYIRTDNRFGAQGRNWLPFMLPIFWVSLEYAPRALRAETLRWALRFGVLLGLLFYATVGSAYALRAVRKHYYFSPEEFRNQRALIRAPLGPSARQLPVPMDRPRQMCFRCPVDRIEAVEVFVSTLKHSSAGTLALRLSGDDKHVLRTAQVNAGQIANDGYQEFRIPVLTGVRGELLRMELAYVPGTINEKAGIKVWSAGDSNNFIARLVSSDTALLVRHYGNKQEFGPRVGEPHAPVLLAGNPREFSLVCGMDSLQGVEVLLSTSGKTNPGTITLEAFEEGGSPLGMSSLEARCLTDNSPRWFPLPTLPGLRGRRLRLRLEYKPPPGEVGAVVAWVDPNKADAFTCRVFGE